MADLNKGKAAAANKKGLTSEKLALRGGTRFSNDDDEIVVRFHPLVISNMRFGFFLEFLTDQKCLRL